MKKIYLILSFLTYFSFLNLCLGQQGEKASYLVSGRVVDALTGDPLEYTTVSLHSKADSSLVTGNITDASGKFEIPAPAGEYWVEVQFISYKSKTIPNVSLNQKSSTVELGNIKLTEDSETLSEVVVAGEKQQMELSLDKRIFNVSSDLTNRGKNASEILDNVPSVTVDIEGNVSLRGSSNVRILVNGKPSGLVGLSSPDALRMLQGDLIERIEVITNPSARYEAEGMAGIINIILKKEREDGINGSFTLNLGTPKDFGASANINLRKKWANLFASYGFNYRENPGSGASYQEYYRGGDSTSFTRNVEDRLRTGLSHTFRIGSDFYLNETSTLTGAILYRISDQENFSDNFYTDRNNWSNTITRTLRADTEMEDESNLEYELNFEKTFDKEEQKLTAAFQYRNGGETERSNIIESVLEGSTEEYIPELYQRAVNKEDGQNVLLQADYVHPFGEDGKFEAGYRSTFRKIETDYEVEEQNKETGEWENIAGFTNHFNYDEKIHSVYAIIGNKTNNFSYQAGLRAELSDIYTELAETNEKNDKEYLNLFPSAHITYELKDDASLQASYSRRLDRPGFWDLNPFNSFSDDRNIRKGNPDLDPDFTDSYEVGYLKNWEKSSLYSGIYYRHTTDVIQRLSSLINDTITLSQPENFGTRDAYGIEANLSKDLASWWQVNVNGNFYRSITDGDAFGKPLKSDSYTVSGRLNSRMTILKTINYQANVNYRAPEEMPQGRRKAFYSIDMALSKDVLQGKGTITLGVRDLLNSRKWRSETYGENFYSDSEFQWRARQFRFSFSYRLNQKKRPERDRGGYEGGGDEGGGEF